MSVNVLMSLGLVAALVSAEAWATCAPEGGYRSCTMEGTRCPGISYCDNYWSQCAPVGGARSCTVCGGAGTQQCDDSGNPYGSCTRAEQCNNCDDDGDGLIDEGLVNCGGVTCGANFETCGDGLDNDCDGATDEGCSSCTSTAQVFPYVFDQLNEMRLDSLNAATYGKRMYTQWKFIPSHRMSSMSFELSKLDLEQGYDYFVANGYGVTGLATTVAYTPYFSVAAPSPVPLRIQTDHSIQKGGVTLSGVLTACGNGGGANFYTIGVNEGYDGVLLHTNDNAYVSFYLPENREAFINLDHDFAPGLDFNIYATVGSGNFGTSCATSAFCADGYDATGEAIHIPAQGTNRVIRLNIHSRNGRGRYRLFVASPVVSYSEDVELAYDGNVLAGSADDLRAKNIWGRTQQLMLAATDGQYRIGAHALVARDVSCFSCYNVIFSEENDLGGCVAGKATISPFGYIEIPSPYWRGQISSCFPAVNTESRVAETVVHEWGHHEFELCDEYGGAFWCNPGGTAGVNRCGFSLMGGTANANFLSGNHHWEFCTDTDHGMDPKAGESPASGDSAWDDITEEYSQMSMPTRSPDFSRLKSLGNRMGQGHFVSFSGP
ncbi:hypothetical protein [Melittangium boletus]|uniref:hypothetical protein n=1 Tax=Melittangium boletus TaxID=83453 RepID=UPI003DA58CAA